MCCLRQKLCFGHVTVYMVLACICLSCTLVDGVIPSCPTNITIGWQNRPPFATSTRENVIFGSTATPLQRMIDTCCDNSTNVTYVDLTNISLPFLSHDVTFLIPVSRTSLQASAFSHVSARRFIPTMQGGGAVYVTYPRSTSESNALVSVFTQGWPFLLLIVVVSFYGALIVWICDSYWNPKHFPAFCMRGVWEGIWWAIVSMTTVGYGDRIPRSFVARIVSILVIFQGLVICTLFTAGVTGFVANTQPPSVTSKTVGVLSDSSEYRIALSNNAKPVEFNLTQDVIDSVINRNISGALLDSYQWRFYVTEQADNDPFLLQLELYDVYKADVFYGIMAKDIDKHLYECMTAVAIDTEHTWERVMQLGWRLLEQANQDGIKNKQLRNVLSSDNSIVVGTAYALAAWFVIVAIITICQVFYYRKRKVSIPSLLGDCNFTHQKDSDGSYKSVQNGTAVTKPSSAKTGPSQSLPATTYGVSRNDETQVDAKDV